MRETRRVEKSGRGWPAVGGDRPRDRHPNGVPAMTFLHRALARPIRGAGALGRRSAVRPVVAVVAAVALAGTGIAAAVAAAPPPAHGGGTKGLKRVGPIDESNGFPLWYEDTNGVKLELCLDPADTNCIMGDVPNPDLPVKFPDNFPDEAFWSAAEASLDAGGGEKALLVTAVEAAFGSADGLPAENQQISFGRIRVRAAGLVDGATYTVTHPYGTDTTVAEAGAVKGINVTEDVGSLVWDGVFDTTLGSRPGPFLKWDPAVEPQAPAGYLGDVTVGHAVVGSPYDTNVFRIEGPAGSFTGSADLCADAGLGDSPTATDDCIETDQFFVQGKKATRMGVQVTKAEYRSTGSGSSKYVDVRATSETGQRLVVSGASVSDTVMSDGGDGNYFARVFVDGAAPADLVVTNVTDTPDTTDRVGALDDTVHVTSATWDTGSRQLRVEAESGAGADLTLVGYPAASAAAGSNGTVFTVTVQAPPAEVEVRSSGGGADTDDVVVKGSEYAASDVTAVITPSLAGDITVGQTISFDGADSTGTVSSYAWSVTPTTGGPLSATSGTSTSFKPSAAGTYTVTLQVRGTSASNVDTAEYTFTVDGASQPPTANAGTDVSAVVPGTLLTLDGTASQNAVSYAWTGPAGVTITNPSSPTPTVSIPTGPTQNTAYTFTLTVTGAPGTPVSTDSVTVTTQVDVLTVASATFKRGGAEWRVRGDALYCAANNTVRVYWMNGTTKTLLGSTTPAADLGVCGYDFRLKNAPANLTPGGNGQVVVESVLGGRVTGSFTRI